MTTNGTMMRKKFSIKHRLASSVRTNCCRRLFFFCLRELILSIRGAQSSIVNKRAKRCLFCFRVTKFNQPLPLSPGKHYAGTGFRGSQFCFSRGVFPDCEILFSFLHHPDEPEAPLFRHTCSAFVLTLFCLLLSWQTDYQMSLNVNDKERQNSGSLLLGRYAAAG